MAELGYRYGEAEIPKHMYIKLHSMGLWAYCGLTPAFSFRLCSRFVVNSDGRSKVYTLFKQISLYISVVFALPD